MDNKAFFNISYGLYVVTAHEGEKDNGCISNTVVQVTDSPKRISVTLNKNNYTTAMIEHTGLLCVSILTEEASFETFKHWGFQSGANVDKAVGITFSRADNGVIYVTEGVNAVLCAKVITQVDLGTHITFVADVTDAMVLGDVPSTTYTYYHKHIKPQPAMMQRKGWICTVCGHIYEGEKLPEGYICPLCKHDASFFKLTEVK